LALLPWRWRGVFHQLMFGFGVLLPWRCCW
jgi:hypothetical protein